jgi:hypothetical protein
MSGQYAMFSFVRQFMEDVQEAAQDANVDTQLIDVFRAGHVAMETARTKGIPNEATRKAAARQFVDSLKG